MWLAPSHPASTFSEKSQKKRFPNSVVFWAALRLENHFCSGKGREVEKRNYLNLLVKWRKQLNYSTKAQSVCLCDSTAFQSSENLFLLYFSVDET